MKDDDWMTTNLQINKLQFSYDNHFELYIERMSIMKGEIFGLLGPSGSGKTTLINILTNEISDHQGRVEVCGKNTNELDYKQIGIMTDQSNLYENLTLKENFAFFSRLKNGKNNFLIEMIDTLGLNDHLNKKFSQCSSGMKKRALLIVAILNKPEVLFLDEPTNGLDPVMKKKVYDVLNTLKNNGTTIFLSTHDMLEAEYLCTKISFIKEGKIIASGTIQNFEKESMETSEVLRITTTENQVYQYSLNDLKKILKKENSIKSIEVTTFKLNDLFLKLMNSGGEKL